MRISFWRVHLFLPDDRKLVLLIRSSCALPSLFLRLLLLFMDSSRCYTNRLTAARAFSAYPLRSRRTCCATLCCPWLPSIVAGVVGPRLRRPLDRERRDRARQRPRGKGKTETRAGVQQASTRMSASSAQFPSQLCLLREPPRPGPGPSHSSCRGVSCFSL